MPHHVFTAAGQDAVAWALVDAMREPDGMVKGMASMVLSGFAQTSKRRVDWRPAAPAIHAILDGTSVDLALTLMRILRDTGVQPDEARIFLRDGGSILLTYAAAERPDLRETAHRLLVALSGLDFGSDVARWREWIATL